MQETLNLMVVTFLALFFTIDVIGVTPVFVSLTANTTAGHKRRMVSLGILVSSLILMFFALTGTTVLNVLGISLAAFRIAGGILLLLLSIDMVLAKPSSGMRLEAAEETEEAMSKYDISVFPLAIPLLSGPAAITMVILFMKQAEGDFLRQSIIISALAVNMLICWFVLSYSDIISKALGKIGINVLNRIFGIMLTALSCQFFIDGILEAFFKR
jgi:multiple antibiotic resistance protein